MIGARALNLTVSRSRKEDALLDVRNCCGCVVVPGLPMTAEVTNVVVCLAAYAMHPHAYQSPGASEPLGLGSHAA